MFQIFRVTGESLLPEYQEGDYVVLATLPFLFNPIQVGDVIVFKNESYGTMIKRVQSVDNDTDRVFVVGTRMDSVDSRRFGSIPKKSITGKVIWHIRKPGRNT